MPWILHASDPHLGSGGIVRLDDVKESFSQPDLETTQRVFRRSLLELGPYVAEHGRPDAVVVSGDLTFQGDQTGFDAFSRLLEEAAAVLPADRSHVVVVPGNHDVLWQEEPGTAARYRGFLGCTRNQGCTTPLIDGVDFAPDTGVARLGPAAFPHVLTTDEVVVVPINSSNWCGALVQPRGTISLDNWETELSSLGARKDELLNEIKKLQRRDIARISRFQIESLRRHLADLDVGPDRRGDHRVRIAVLHHQLLPVSSREERRSYEAIINLGLVREFLAAYGFDIVLHGHKHDSSMYWDLDAGPASDLNAPRSRRLVVSSPGHFEVGQPVLRAIEIEPPTIAPSARIITFTGAGAEHDATPHDGGQRVPLWHADHDRREQTAVRGASVNECYGRLRSTFALRDEAELRNVVCEVERVDDAGRLPDDYPAVGVADREAWFSSLVDWWQLDHSDLVARGLVDFNHGDRIYRRWGDQIQRAIRILNDRASSSRALVQLVAPRETGRYPSDARDLHRGSFPAFVAAEFTVAEHDGQRALHCFAYFRKQEMQFWWPVNVAELAQMQSKILGALREPAVAGRIVTLSAVALWKTALPGVAVPLIDLWVEDRIRLLTMATATAFPAEATADALSDWREALSDLRGADRPRPPNVRAGATVLLDYLKGLATATRESGFALVVERLTDLQLLYAAHAGGDLSPQAALDATRRINRLSEAVQALLPIDLSTS